MTVVLSGQERVLVKNCHGFIDFSDPKYMPWEEACEFYSLCKGDVFTTKIVINWWCDDDGENCMYSQPGRFTVHQSGEQLVIFTTEW